MNLNSRVFFKILLILYIFLSLGKILSSNGDTPYGRYYCEKENTKFLYSYQSTIPLNPTNISNRVIGDDNGRGIIIQNQIIGGLSYNYVINDAGGFLFSLLSSDPCYYDNTFANKNLNYFLMLFSLCFFAVILVKISSQKIFLNLTILYLLLYLISFVFTDIFKRYYGLSLVDNIKSNFLIYETQVSFMNSLIEIFKSLLLPEDSYSMWGINPRNYALSLLFFAVCSFILNKSNYSIYLITLSCLFHLWSSILFLLLFIIMLIISKNILDNRKLLIKNLILSFILLVLPLIKPLETVLSFLYFLIFTVVFLLFLKYSHSSITPEGINFLSSKSKSILVISFLFLYYAISLIISIYFALDTELMIYLKDWYILRGFIAEGSQRLSPVLIPILLVHFFSFSPYFKKIKIL